MFLRLYSCHDLFFLGNNDYSSDAVDFFRQLAPKEKMFKFKFDKTKEQTYPMTIEMFMDENCQKTFAEVLIRRRFVKSIDPPPEWNPMAADYQKPGNLLCPILFDSARPRSIYYALFFRLFTKLCYVIREINRSTNRMESKRCRLPKTM